MSNDTLRAEIADRICTITFTRAEQYNTITLAMRDELAATLDEANANDDVRVILIRAEAPPSVRVTDSTGPSKPRHERNHGTPCPT